MMRRVAFWGLAGVLLGAMLGCPLMQVPPLSYEELYGYNTIRLINQNDRPIEGLYLTFTPVSSDTLTITDPYESRNLIAEQEPDGVAPGETFSVGGLENGTYDIRIEYGLTEEEHDALKATRQDEGTDDTEEEDPYPEKVYQTRHVHLAFGETYDWYWDSLIPDGDVETIP